MDDIAIDDDLMSQETITDDDYDLREPRHPGNVDEEADDEEDRSTLSTCSVNSASNQHSLLAHLDDDDLVCT